MDLNKRLSTVLKKDKENNPKYLLDVIKSDFYYLINNYFEVDFKDIDIDITVQNESYKISLTSKGERMKMMQALPDN